MKTFSGLLALCAGNSPVTGEFPAQRLVTRSFDVFFDLRLNKGLNKQSWGWWFETPSRSLWRYCNGVAHSSPTLSCGNIHALPCDSAYLPQKCIRCWWLNPAKDCFGFIVCCVSWLIEAGWRIYASVNYPPLVQIMAWRWPGDIVKLILRNKLRRNFIPNSYIFK